jgi:pimeloyl-ACP methyl ester carboxylesterase
MPDSGLHLELLHRIGLSPREALAAATSHYADVYGWPDVGRIEPGRVATCCFSTPIHERTSPPSTTSTSSCSKGRSRVLLPGVGHWTEQEAPTEVNRLMVDFLGSAGGNSAAK